MDSTPNTGGVVESTMQPRLSGSAAARVNVRKGMDLGTPLGVQTCREDGGPQGHQSVR